MTNRVHPTAILHDGVELGSGNTVGPYAVVAGPCRIGDENWIGPHAAIGMPAQHREGPHRAWDEPQGPHGVAIGSGNRIREFTTVHQGWLGVTTVGDHCYLMAYAHIPHDASIESGVTLANAVQIGGHTWIGSQATVGLGASIRQRLCIGALAMVGMNATVTSNIPPFGLAVGSPARVIGANRVGLMRSGFTDEQMIDDLDRALKETGVLPESTRDEGQLREMILRYEEMVVNLS